MEQLKLNMIPNGVNPVFHASQYDKGRQIRFVLDETLSSAEVTVSYRAKDGTEYGNVQMSVSGNTITDTIPEEVLTDYGIIEGEVNIDGIGSLNFFVEVEKDAYDGGVITTQTASGAIATFETNIETAFVSLKSDINPVQDLHGYSKPWSGGGGKNKFNGADVGTTYPANWGVEFSGDVLTITHKTSYTTGIPTYNLNLPVGMYIVSYASITKPNSISLYVNGAYNKILNNGTTFTIEDGKMYSMTFASDEGTPNVITKLQIESGSTVTDYEPYENICPISGFNALSVTRTGVNLFDGSKVTTTTPSNWGVSFDSDTSTLTIEHKNTYSSGIPVFNIPSFVGDMIISGTFGADIDLYVNGMWNRSMASGASFSCTSGNTYTLVFNNPSQSTLSYKVQLELGNIAHAFTPYNGQTATVNFGQTVYGGVADVTNGKLTITHKYKLLTGDASETWYTYGDSGWRLVVSDQKGDGGEGWCNVAPTVSSVNVYGVVFGISTTYIYFAQTVSAWGCSTEAQLRTWLSNNNVEIVYPLATPIEITTTPENLTAIVGENNVYGDTNGDTTVEYYIEV